MIKSSLIDFIIRLFKLTSMGKRGKPLSDISFPDIDLSIVLEMSDGHYHEREFGTDVQKLKECIAYRMNEYIADMIEKHKSENIKN